MAGDSALALPELNTPESAGSTGNSPGAPEAGRSKNIDFNGKQHSGKHMKTFDVVVIGSGTSGQSAAMELSLEGLNTALVERSDRPGGVCALRGCQAKKWFYEAAEIVGRSRHLRGMGIEAEPLVDWQRIRAEKNRFTAAVPENTVKTLRGHGITYIEGEARFLDDSTLQVGEARVSARFFIIASGAKPTELPIDGSEHLATSSDFLDLDDLPSRIGFIGGGFVSFELAHFAARLGAAPTGVHIIEAAARPLLPFDADMVARLVAASEEDGIHVHTGVSITAVKKTGSCYQIEMESGSPLEVDLVVNGAGRTPNIEALQLDKAGVRASRGGIEVDMSMRSSNPHIFAVGDCADTVKLARVADREAQVAAGAILARERGGQAPFMEYRAVPSVLFTYPQLGMVGKTEKQLQEEKIDYWKSQESELSWPTYRRLGMKHAAYKILVDRDNRLLGAHFLLDNTTGVLNTFKQAIIDKIPVAKLHDDNIMAPYPSRESDITYMLAPLLDS